MSPQFLRRSQQPLRSDSIRAAVRQLRLILDRLESHADAQTPQQKRARTLAVHGLTHAVRRLSARYRAMTISDVIDEEAGERQTTA